MAAVRFVSIEDQQIRERAYQRWERRGRLAAGAPEQALEDWLAAERELLVEQIEDRGASSLVVESAAERGGAAAFRLVELAADGQPPELRYGLVELEAAPGAPPSERRRYGLVELTCPRRRQLRYGLIEL